MLNHKCEDLILIFNNLFQMKEKTLLVGEGVEPFYIPANFELNTTSYNKIIFRENFYSSALHEIAHWCIAGKERRKQPDFGYWYQSKRNCEEQTNFEHVEIKPQAIEWIFSEASGVKFNVSVDNFELKTSNSKFYEEISKQVEIYLQQGLPHRAELFKNSLLNFYGRELK